MKVVRVSDPQVAPGGKTIAFTVGRANLKDDRWDTEIDVVDVATHTLRVMTHGKLGVGSPRWSYTGDRLAFLAQDADKKAQLWILPMAGGDSLQVTHSKTPVKTFAWRPDGEALVYAAEDEAPEKKDQAKFDDAFEVGNNGYVERIPTLPMHLWTVSSTGENEKRLTSGSWSAFRFRSHTRRMASRSSSSAPSRPSAGTMQPAASSCSTSRPEPCTRSPVPPSRR